MFYHFIGGKADFRGAGQVCGINGSAIAGAGEPGAGGFTEGAVIFPADIDLLTVTRQLETAPQSLTNPHDTNHRFKRGDNSAITPTRTITGPASSLTVVENVVLPGVDPSSDATIRGSWNYINFWGTNADANVSGFLGMSMRCPSYPRTSFYCGGSETTNQTALSFVGSSRFEKFQFNVIDSTDTVEAAKQMAWPCAGQFQYFKMAYTGVAAGNTYRMILRINGNDTALVLDTTVTATWVVAADMATVVPVNAGDLVCWDVHKTAGTGSTLKLLYTIGFTS